MPVATQNSGIGSVDLICENISTPNFENSVGGPSLDLKFLTEFLNSPALQSLIEAHDKLEEAILKPVGCDGIELLQEITEELRPIARQNSLANELYRLLDNPNMRSLIGAHDDVAAKNYEISFDTMPMFPSMPQLAPTPTQDAIRMVGIRKNVDEPLGLTLRLTDTGELAIARVLTGGTVANQGLLHTGDIIKEINGQEVNDPDQLQEIMKKCSGSVTLKVLPSYLDQTQTSQIYVKTHFSYNPLRDNLIPSRDAGLAFKEGEILHVLSMDDNNWWQARKVEENGPSGLIPSQSLEEKRKAFVKPEYDYTQKSLLCGLVTKKKKKMMYQSTRNSEFDRHEMKIYEEVARMPPFQRRTLILVGAQGVGRRTLKQRLLKSDPTRFGSIIPFTSRTPKSDEIDGDAYWFLPHDVFHNQIEDNKYLEHGMFDGSFYGTKYDSIRSVISSGRMCILDISPQALKSIKTPEFMPYVVFIAAAPVDIMRNMHEYARLRGRTDKLKTEKDFRSTVEESKNIEATYKQYFDLTIVNDNLDETYHRLRRAIETLSLQAQWVPVSWVY